MGTMKNWNVNKTVVNQSVNADNAYVIEDVATDSPAHNIGIEPGDLLISVNGKNDLNQVDIDTTLVHRKAIVYRIFSQRENNLVDINIDPIPLGIRVAPNSTLIVNQYKSRDFPGWEGMRILWNRGDWQQLKVASEQIYSSGFFTRLVRNFSADHKKNAGMLYLGAALIEAGSSQEGWQLISEFLQHYSHQYETLETAIGQYYALQYLPSTGDNQEALISTLSQLRKNNGNELERINSILAKHSIDASDDRYPWLGQQFVKKYYLRCPALDHHISLAEQLNAMDDNALQPICVMPGYRGNYPYNSALGIYGSMYRYLGDRLLPLHVIVDDADTEGQDYWRYSNEDVLKKNNIPFYVLIDEERDIASRLELNFSPVFYLLDKDGNIVYEGELNSASIYWNIFNG